MSKKHFVAFAKYIKDHLAKHPGDPIVMGQAHAMADMVIAVASASNPLFNPERFRAYCGLL